MENEIHEQILMSLIRPPGKLYTRGVESPFGMLDRAPGGHVSCRILSQQEFFENVPDFPRERTGPDGSGTVTEPIVSTPAAPPKLGE